MDRKLIGTIGEQKVCKWYTDKGFKLITVNYKSRFGEIDIITKINDLLVFVEVKTRNSNKFANASEFVDIKKQERIKKTASIYLSKNNHEDNFVRFDVAEVYYKDNNFIINIIESAFE